MPITVKSLADGQLANAKATIYTTPALTTTIVRAITLVNTGAGTNNVNLYKKKSGGTSRRIYAVAAPLASGDALNLQRVITLGPGDILEGDATTAAEVDYTIDGVERT